MAKLYATTTHVQKMIPKKETVQFLLHYSKALKVVKKGSFQFEFISN
ncbi:hypothetical protein [Flavobacterium sp.]|jgi:hypothetical protein|nr:hypothetical protein [Flavobacterium sp.]